MDSIPNEITAILGAVALIWFVRRVTRKPPTEEQVRLDRWQKLSTDTTEKYSHSHDVRLDLGHNPMQIAIERRNTLIRLLRFGHATAASNVLEEVNQIMLTIEANHIALDGYGFGVFKFAGYSNGTRLYRWEPNDNPNFEALRVETYAMLDSINELIRYVRSIGAEGVRSSVASAKVGLQVHLQDLEAGTKANQDTAKELESRPL